MKTKGLPLVIHDDYNSTDYTILRTYGSFQALGDIKASKTDTLSGNITAGGQVIAHNGYGDEIRLGGDAAGDDYEINLQSPKRLTIFSPKVPVADRKSTVVFRVKGAISSEGNLTASGNITATENVKGATLESTGRATVGEFVQVNGTVSEGDSCSTNGLMGRTGNGTPMYCIDGYWTNIVSSKTKNGGMLLPGGMKMMWGTLSENLTDYGSLDGLSYFESKFKRHEPTFIANGKTYKFSNIFSVQFTPVDVGGAAMERMWGAPYSSGFSYAFSSAIKTTMTGTYLAIGY